MTNWTGSTAYVHPRVDTGGIEGFGDSFLAKDLGRSEADSRADSRLDILVPLIQERIKRLDEAAEWLDWAFVDADADPVRRSVLAAGEEAGRRAEHRRPREGEGDHAGTRTLHCRRDPGRLPRSCG
ncbi:MAG: hypothetical protein R2873_10980 [Caldilineaceae bacterium]